MNKKFKVTAYHRIMAIDPGKTDGFATSGPDVIDNRTFQYSGNHDGFLQQMNEFQPDIIVYEAFNNRQKDKVELISVEHIGMIKWYAERRNLPIFEQTSAYGKSFFDNTKLRRLKLYEPAKPHAMDALRHLLQFKVKYDLFDLWLLNDK